MGPHKKVGAANTPGSVSHSQQKGLGYQLPVTSCQIRQSGESLLEYGKGCVAGYRLPVARTANVRIPAGLRKGLWAEDLRTRLEQGPEQTLTWKLVTGN